MSNDCSTLRRVMSEDMMRLILEMDIHVTSANKGRQPASGRR
jgi:hypothetical protein